MLLYVSHSANMVKLIVNVLQVTHSSPKFHFHNRRNARYFSSFELFRNYRSFMINCSEKYDCYFMFNRVRINQLMASVLMCNLRSLMKYC